MVQVISSMVDIRTSCYAARLAAFSCPQKHWKALIFRGAPKRIPSPLRDDVNDFMLAVLDPAARTLTIRVSSTY